MQTPGSAALDINEQGVVTPEWASKLLMGRKQWQTAEILAKSRIQLVGGTATFYKNRVSFGIALEPGN
jgi:hypothetical protein